MVQLWYLFIYLFLSDQSKEESWVLKSQTITVLELLCPFRSKTWFIYLGGPVLSAYIFTVVVSSCWIVLSIYDNYFLSLFTLFHLKFTLPCMIIATPACFWFPFVWISFSNPTLLVYCYQLSESLVSNKTSWILFPPTHTFHLASLCPLIGEFNSFAFKVIINEFEPCLLILLIFLGFFFCIFFILFHLFIIYLCDLVVFCLSC
jgi:hypothetical protein